MTEPGINPGTAGAGPATDPATGGAPLRAWQRTALRKYLMERPRDFLAVATPGAGKTTFGLRVAAELLRDKTVEAITVVAPTEHLKFQWAQAAARVGILLDPEFSNTSGALAPEYDGVVVTYAQVAAHPFKHRQRTVARRTLVVSALTGAALAAAGLGLALGLGFALGLFRPHPAGAAPDTRSVPPRHPERLHAGR